MVKGSRTTNTISVQNYLEVRAVWGSSIYLKKRLHLCAVHVIIQALLALEMGAKTQLLQI